MSTLYVVQAQPNPPGRDAGGGHTTNEVLNEEWVEFEAVGGNRNLVGDEISHVTFTATCSHTGEELLLKFGPGELSQGRRLRLHTGRGTEHWTGTTYHMYLGRGWFVWNNDCGDRVTVRFQGQVVDSAAYASRPPEGILSRVPNTDRLEPSYSSAARW